jgi:hypothetical protein
VKVGKPKRLHGDIHLEKNIIYESMLILLRERAILKSLILHVFQLREFYDVLLAKYNMLLVIEIDEDINIWCGEF